LIIEEKGTNAHSDENEQTSKPMLATFIGWLLMQRFTADVTNIGCDRVIGITPRALYDVVVHGRTPQRFGLAKSHFVLLINVSANGQLHDFKKKMFFQSF
jgi:hypothetical protein